jgi:pentatricopeptide repeat protein
VAASSAVTSDSGTTHRKGKTTKHRSVKSEPAALTVHLVLIGVHARDGDHDAAVEAFRGMMP